VEEEGERYNSFATMTSWFRSPQKLEASALKTVDQASAGARTQRIRAQSELRRAELEHEVSLKRLDDAVRNGARDSMLAALSRNVQSKEDAVERARNICDDFVRTAAELEEQRVTISQNAVLRQTGQIRSKVLEAVEATDGGLDPIESRRTEFMLKKHRERGQPRTASTSATQTKHVAESERRARRAQEILNQAVGGGGAPPPPPPVPPPTGVAAGAPPPPPPPPPSTDSGPRIADLMATLVIPTSPLELLQPQQRKAVHFHGQGRT
jgi:hypothetical protein